MVPTRIQSILDHPIAQHPLVRRITGYSAGSIVALIISELAFIGVLGWGHAGTLVATTAGFVGGAVPNYILNRRWAWRDRRGRNRRTEISLYACVSLAFFLVAFATTHYAELGARHLTTNGGWQVILVSGVYLATSAVFFVLKFLIYETVVFKKHADETVTALFPQSDATVALVTTQSVGTASA
jgi:putative flippase GtrA